MPQTENPARWWLATIPHHEFLPFLPPGITYIKGQLESGSTTDYLHWQLVFNCKKPQRLAAIKRLFGRRGHYEPTRSDAALEYVWKDETSVDGTRFELGTLPVKRNCETDWARVKDLAKRGRLDDIESSIFVRNYRTLKQISADYCEPTAIEREVVCFWGTTGTGKSRRAWEEAGLHAYPKDPRSKFWDGYRGMSTHNTIVMDWNDLWFLL